MTSLKDLIDGKIIAYSKGYVTISKDGRQFQIEFDSINIQEMKKMQ